ncbi:MAG: hypothetical protein IT435_01410 [Phycisphaerales bacterium]|nr:hypothetical protein [Phycisphaerales bacterium]
MLALFAGTGLVIGQDAMLRPSAVTFAGEGTIDSSLATSGSGYRSGEDDREAADDLWYDSITELADGRFTRDPDRGFYGDPGESNGARYMNDRGYPAGWYFANYGGTQEVELLVERPAFAPGEFDFEGTYRYNLIGMKHEGVHSSYAAAGGMEIDNDQVSYDESIGDQPYDGSFISSINGDGVLKTSRDEYMYLNATGNTVIFADMSSGDNLLHVGVATRAHTPQNQQAMIGKYMLAWGVPSGNSIEFSQLLLDLESDGDYKFYDLDKYDSGDFEVIERGFWSVSGSTVVLDHEETNDEIRLTIGENGKLLIAMQARSNNIARPIFAMGTRVNTLPGGDKAYFSLDAVEDARSKVYQLETDGNWYRTDLQDQGGPAITGPVVTWVDAKDNLTYAASVTASGTTLYTQSAEKLWSFRNLTTELAGSTRIAGELCVMEGPDGTIHLTGIDQNGDLVRYYQTGGTVAGGGFAWAFENITTTSLEPNGLSTPAFDGLVTFATSWGALNIAGLDASGDVQAVWWAPGMPAWTTNNLSEEYGSDPLEGGLTVWLTEWDAINIGGVSSAGELLVTWWVPQNGFWIQSNLTEVIDGDSTGPLLEGISTASFVSEWGAMNIAGIERGTGRTVVYWWTPQSDQLWHVVDMTAALPQGTPQLTTLLEGIASSDTSLNVIGMSGTHVYRYYWRNDLGTGWHGQDLTVVATERG